MNKATSRLSILFAGLLAVAGAQAQSTPAAGSTDSPMRAGEASTQTRGVPNAATTNSPVTEAPTPSREMMRREAQGMGAAGATTSVPVRAGEATTMMRGRPNANTEQPPLPFRHYSGVGVPATLPEHSPSVFEGGTPQ